MITKCVKGNKHSEKVKLKFIDRRTDRETDRNADKRPGLKCCDHDLSIRGHKNTWRCRCLHPLSYVPIILAKHSSNLLTLVSNNSNRMLIKTKLLRGVKPLYYILQVVLTYFGFPVSLRYEINYARKLTNNTLFARIISFSPVTHSKIEFNWYYWGPEVILNWGLNVS